MREACANAAGKALASRDAFDGRTHDRHVPRGNVQHALDCGGIPGRALAFDPALEALQHGLGIEGKIGWVHGLLPAFEVFLDGGAYERERRTTCKVKTRRGLMG